MSASNGTNGTPKRRRDWKPKFLAAFEESGMVAAACEAANVGRTTAYRNRQEDEDFALAWADIEERSTERMEREAYRRAVEGVDKPMVSAGKMVTTVKEYSDTLLIFMLKSRRPETYRDNVKVEHSGSLKSEVELVGIDDPDKRVRALRMLQAALPDE